MTYQGVFEIRFPNLGVSLRDGQSGEVTQWSLKSDFLTPTDGWSLQCLDTRDLPRWYETQPCEIYINGRLQLLGRCDSTERGGANSIITLHGRDYLADLTECQIDPAFTVRAGTTLESALLMAMGPCGITSIETAGQRNAQRTGGLGVDSQPLTVKQLQDIKPGANQSIFGWCARIAARYGLMLQPGSSRASVVVQAPSYGGAIAGRIVSRRRGSASSMTAANMLLGGAGRAVRNYSSIPTYLIAAGQQGKTGEPRTKTYRTWEMLSAANAIGGEFAQIVNAVQAGRRKPTDVVGAEIENNWLYRLRYFRDKASKTQDELNGAVARLVAQSLKDSLTYSCTIRGTTSLPDGAGYTWAPDTEIEVDDDIARVHERLWIANREFSGGADGVLTNLECWRPRSFQIDPESNG